MVKKFYKYYVKYNLLIGGNFKEIFQNLINDQTISLRDLEKLREISTDFNFNLKTVLNIRVTNNIEKLTLYKNKFNKLVEANYPSYHKNKRSDSKKHILEKLKEIENSTEDYEYLGQQGEMIFLENSTALHFIDLLNNNNLDETINELNTLKISINDIKTKKELVEKYEEIDLDWFKQYKKAETEIENLKSFLEDSSGYAIELYEENLKSDYDNLYND